MCLLLYKLSLYLPVVCVSRNVKDAAVSYYMKSRGELQGSFADFIDLFKDGTLTYGNYWTHLKVRASSRGS